jgi:N-acetylglutamate synthase-like GNAT family acetyltransferase
MTDLATIKFSHDKSLLDIVFIHQFLSTTYWSKGISISVVEKAIENSFCFAAFDGEQQIGFARLITDYATFGYLADVFVIDGYRGYGIGKGLVEGILAYFQDAHLRRVLLATADAHTLYEKYGFKALAKQQNFMEINKPNIYLDLARQSN